MPTRLSLFSLVAAGFVVAAQGPFTSSLVNDPDIPTPPSPVFTTVFTTVTTTVTTLPATTTITISPSATTTTLSVSSLLPVTTTTTVYSTLLPSSSATNIIETPMESGTPLPLPTHHGSGSLTQNPGALAGLIIGLCVLVAGLAIFTWFTINRHRLRELEINALTPPPIDAVRYSTSAGGAPPGHGNSRAFDDDLDNESQTSIGREVRSSSTDHGLGHSFSGILVHGDSPDPTVDYKVGYFANDPTAASSNGHSSHGNGTVITRNSSLTHVTGTRNTSPTLPRKNPNRARFSLSPDRFANPSAWQIPRSEGSTRRASIDDGSTISYHPHRVNSDPIGFHDAPHVMPVFSRRQSSEIPRPEMSQRPRPSIPILVHPPLPSLPSSLLRPPSAPQIPTLDSLQRYQPSVYLGPPLVNEPIPSPAASNLSILPMREHLLGSPNHPSSSEPSLRDERDYSRPLSVIGAEPDSDSEIHPHRDFNQRRSTLG